MEKNHLFALTVLPLIPNLVYLFILFSFTLCLVGKTLKHNLTTWKRFPRVRCCSLPSLALSLSPDSKNLYFYTCLLSHLMKQNLKGMENLCCVWWKCLNHFFSFLLPPAPSSSYRIRVVLSKRENYSCPWVREIAWRGRKGKKSEHWGVERRQEVGGEARKEKRINYTISCDI